MIRLARALHAERRQQMAAEGGFALVFVLGVIALVSVTLTALVGLLMVTMQLTEQQGRSADERRALDGAIEAATNQLRFNPGAVFSDPCGSLAPVDPVTAVDFDLGTTGTGDDIEVEIACSEGTTGSAQAASDRVRLVGLNGYQGPVAWAGFPWLAATGQAVDPALQKPNLVHSGSSPLRFDSGVTVRNGSAVLRDPVDSSPAVVTSGEYIQGSPGPLASAANGDCGVAGGSGGLTDAGRISDLDGVPECDSAEARAVDATPTDATAGFAVDGDFGGLAAQTAPNRCVGTVIQIQPGRYDQTQVTRLNEILNPVPVAQGGSGLAQCYRDTIHFLPGVFYFDADYLDFNNPSGSYVFGEPLDWDAVAGGGVLQSPATHLNPEARLCDESRSGATIVLSARTEIRHRQGRLAMCPAFDPITAKPLPAIYQETSVPRDIELTGLDLNDQGLWTRLFRCQPDLFDSTKNPTAPPHTCRNDGRHRWTMNTAGAEPITGARVLIRGTEPPETANNLVNDRRTTLTLFRSSGSQLCTTGKLSGTPNGNLTSSYNLLSGTGSDSCASVLPGTNETVLQGGSLRVTHEMTLQCLPFFPFPCADQRLTVDQVELQINMHRSSAPDGVTSDGSLVNPLSIPSSFTSPVNVTTDDANAAVPDMGAGCTTYLCLRDAPGLRPTTPFRHQIRLTDIDLPIPPEYVAESIDPNLSRLWVRMSLDPSAPMPPWFELTQYPWFRPEMNAVIELDAGASGQRCIAQAGFTNSTQELAFDLLDASFATDGCNAVLSNYSQLQDLDLTVTFEMPCVKNYPGGAPWDCFRLDPTNIFDPTPPVWQVRPPAIRHLRLEATTDTFVGVRPQSSATINTRTVAAGSGGNPVWGDSFNVMGEAWMPLHDLTIRWNGGITPGRPLFSSDLVLGGLASTTATAAGVSTEIVCCEERRPDARVVLFTASIEGEPRLEVRVQFTDVAPPALGGPATVYAPGHRVDILDWRECRGPCASGP